MEVRRRSRSRLVSLVAGGLVAAGIGLLGWVEYDQLTGQWDQHGLAVADDAVSSAYRDSAEAAYSVQARTFEDAIVAFETGALPIGPDGVELIGSPTQAVADPPPSTTPDDGPVEQAQQAFPGASIRIPSIGVDQVVVEGVTRADLRRGPGHYPGTPQPGMVGNMVISGHRTTYTKPFYDLDLLREGDEILISTPERTFSYTVSWVEVVGADDVRPLRSTDDAALTLTTCHPKGSARQRLVVRAVLAGEVFADARS